MLTKFEKLSNVVNDNRKVIDWSAKDRIAMVESTYTQTMRRFG